jgi:hypothetical protein
MNLVACRAAHLGGIDVAAAALEKLDLIGVDIGPRQIVSRIRLQIFAQRLAGSIGKSISQQSLLGAVVTERAHIYLAVAREVRGIQNRFLRKRRISTATMKGGMLRARAMTDFAGDSSDERGSVVPVISRIGRERLEIRYVAFETTRRRWAIEDWRTVPESRAIDPLLSVRPITHRQLI